MKVTNASGFDKVQQPERHFFSRGSIGVPRTWSDAASPAFYTACYQPFAGVTHHIPTGEIILARDHLGVQPLYYALRPQELIFSENLPDLLCALDPRPEFDDEQLRTLFERDAVYTDRTIYRGVDRVEPGHFLRIAPDEKISKHRFWGLDRQAPYLHYRRDRDYVDHFAALLDESLRVNCAGFERAAAEFSAGIDSVAVIAAASGMGVRPQLFMHGALPGSAADLVYNREYERKFLAHYSYAEKEVVRVRAEHFDPLAVFERQARLFAGAPPYSFFMFADPVHQAVARANHSVLLSGFGGDQGVSGHVPGSVGPVSLPRRLGRAVKRPFRRPAKPVSNVDRSTLRNFEWDLLQGPHSHEIRMRIEYSSIVAKTHGFAYRYPLLYPKLLEFYLAVPAAQKRRGATGRLLIRRYLEKVLKGPMYTPYAKREGLYIMPAAMDLFKDRLRRGEYAAAFLDMPDLSPEDRAAGNQHAVGNHVRAYMLHAARRQNDASAS